MRAPVTVTAMGPLKTIPDGELFVPLIDVTEFYWMAGDVIHAKSGDGLIFSRIVERVTDTGAPVLGRNLMGLP